MKRFAPAAERNVGPIGDALASRLPSSGTALEVASGTGQHACAFAERFAQLDWYPSDVDPEALASIAAHQHDAALANLHPPIALDATQLPWPVPRADVVYCANMIHIAPFECCRGLFAGSGAILSESGALFLYGPFRFSGELTPASNRAFDESLRTRNPSWGVRDTDDLDQLAEAADLERTETVSLPANNHLLVFRRRRYR